MTGYTVNLIGVQGERVLKIRLERNTVNLFDVQGERVSKIRLDTL
jgi:hypothetical protein